MKASSPSESISSVAVMVMLCVALAAELAVKVTVPEVVPRSALSAASVPSGADHATVTSAATAFDSVTVKIAALPSATLADGPLMLSSALSLSSPGVVLLSSSVRVTVAELTLSPDTVVAPGMMMVSSPSTTRSSVGVMVSVSEPLDAFAGMVTLARLVTL